MTDEGGGAFEPDVSPDGRWLAFVAHSGHGFVLRIVDYDPASWQPEPLPPGPEDPIPETYADSIGGPARGSSLRSLWPTSWLPVWLGSNEEQGIFLGPLVFGSDVVERHFYAAAAALSTGTADWEAFAAYSYRGLGNPALTLELEQDWSIAFGVATPTGTEAVLERARSLELSARSTWPRLRRATSLEGTVELRRSDLLPASEGVTLPAGLRPTLTEYGGELNLGLSTARSYPFSVSAEKGVRTALRLRGFRATDDPRLWFASARARVHLYVPVDAVGFARHVIALRLAGGATVYDGRPAIFSAGGVPGSSETLLAGVSVGDGAEFPARGFSQGDAAGDRVVSGNLEYRFPVFLFSRGLGLIPLYFDRLSGSVFVDAASAWGPGGLEGEPRELLLSAGAEIGLDLVLSRSFPYRIRGGVARRLTAPRARSTGWAAYAALGAAF